MKRFLFIPLFCALLCSCYKEIDVDVDGSEAQLVLNCIARNGADVQASVSYSWLYTQEHSSALIQNALVEVFVNGVLKDTMDYRDDLYHSSVHPSSGDTIRVRATVDGETVWAQDVVPQMAKILSVKTTRESNDDEEVADYKIKIQNPAGQTNYYMLLITGEASNEGELVDYSYDPIFQVTNEEINGSLTNRSIQSYMGYPFTSKGMETDEYMLTVKEIVSTAESTNKRKIHLYTISEAYYRYVVNYLANNKDGSIYGELTSLGLAEPLITFTNIQGGLGLLACYQEYICQVSI